MTIGMRVARIAAANGSPRPFSCKTSSVRCQASRCCMLDPRQARAFWTVILHTLTNGSAHEAFPLRASCRTRKHPHGLNPPHLARDGLRPSLTHEVARRHSPPDRSGSNSRTCKSLCLLRNGRMAAYEHADSSLSGRIGEGFRMPAARVERLGVAGVRKPPMHEPAGSHAASMGG